MMEIERITQALIFVHAGFGGIALISGLAALIAKKGQSLHKKAGKMFFYSMLLSAFFAFIISTMPNHKSSFLFAIGIFSSYFIISGYRALRYKHDNPDLKVDKVISWSMIFTAITMIFYPILFTQSINIVLAVFGCIGLILSIRDLKLYNNATRLRSGWLKLHLGKMIGGYIAAATAFVVVNKFFPGFYGWFIPGVVGGFYIGYWMRKLNQKPAGKVSLE